jgi:hypothetical protein
MDAFLNWLTGNQIAMIVLLVALCVVVTIFTVAFLQGKDIQFWPPKISARTRALKIGDVNIPADHSKKSELRENTFKGRRTIVIPVKFDEAFKTRPQIIVGLQKIDVGDFAKPSINRLLVRAENQSLHGFDLVFETWEDSKVWDAAAFWIAVSE